MTDERRINIRFAGEEARRWLLVMERIQARMPGNVKISEATVLRELIGLLPPCNVTEEERRILSHGTELPKPKQNGLSGSGRPRKAEKA